MSTTHPVSAASWAAGRSLADPQLSPTGRFLAYVTGVGARAELAVVDLDGDRVETWLPCEPAVKRASSSGGGVIGWLPDDAGLIYIGADGCLHRIDLDDYRCRNLTTWPSPIASLAVSPDGTRAAYAIDMRDIAVVGTEGAGLWPVRISADADFVMDPTWSADSSLLAWHEWDDPFMAWNNSRIVVRASDGNGPIRTVAGLAPGEEGTPVGVQQPRFSPDGTRLAFLSDANGFLNVWSALTEALEETQPLLEEPFEHGTPTWGPGQRTYAWGSDGRTITVARNEAGRGRLVEHDLTSGAERLVDGRTWTGLTLSGNRLAGVATGPTEALTLQLIQEGRSSTIARGPLAGLERAGVEPELVEWNSDDGALIHGRLYRTATSASPDAPPLLVWIHGGPTAQSGATLYARIAYFVQRGWSVLVADYRGSSGWGRSYMQGLDEQWGVVDVADVAAAMRAASVNGWGDPTKLVPFGASAGGFTALLLLAKFPELCAAGVVMYPVCDLADFGAETWRFEAHYLDSLIGPLPDTYDRYVQRSPITHAASIAAPVLILHGDADNVVPVEQSAILAERIAQAGGQVTRHVYEGEGHSWRKPTTISDELERIQSFLARHVLHINTPTKDES